MASQTETLSPALPPDVERAALDVLRTAVDKDLKLATAESCTGGLLASLLTDVEGCGHCFERGFVTYTDDAKAEQLSVPRELIARHSAVSAEVADAMALGALANSRADLAVAITGYAGRGGPGEEPGLVYISTAARGGEPTTTEHHFGDIGRGEVRLACLRSALKLLLAEI
jgi:nicotinamide-nucleotide amidase